MTDWVALALSGTISFSILSIMEKVLLNRWFSNSKSFCVVIGGVQVFIGLLISLVVPLSLDNYWESYLFAIISGFTSGLMLCIVFYSLKTLDISRVYSLLSSYPIFAAILASLILDEKLEFLDWISIIFVVIGAGIATGTGNINQTKLNYRNLILCMLVILGSGFYGSGEVAYKYALNMNNYSENALFWNLFVLRTLSTGFFLILLSVIWEPVKVIQDLKISLNNISSKVLVIISQVIIAPISIFLQVSALSAGPVSLVTALMASRPLFILGLSSLLSLPRVGILSDSLGKKMILLKLFAILMILTGVIVITAKENF